MRLRSNIPQNVNHPVQENYSVEFAKNPLYTAAFNSNTAKPKSQGRNIGGRFAQTFEKRSRGLAFSQITGDTQNTKFTNGTGSTTLQDTLGHPSY